MYYDTLHTVLNLPILRRYTTLLPTFCSCEVGYE